jgi:hypothetical protein
MECLESGIRQAYMDEKARQKKPWVPKFPKGMVFGNSGKDKLAKRQAEILEAFLLSDLYVVHSLPKVGGSSVAATLKASFEFARVLHAHSLTENGFRTWSLALPEYSELGRYAALSHLGSARTAAMLLEATTMLFPKSRKRAIIGGVREPVSWALSLYFEAYRFFFDENYHRITVEMAREFITKVLTGQMSHLGPPYTNPEKWFNDEFASAHGFNPLTCEFDIKKGYQIYKTDNHPVLMIRQENLSSLAEALSVFLGYPAEFIATVNANTAELKAYSELYRSIKDRLKFDSAFLQSVYSDAYSKRFYSQVERDSFISRWKS